MSLSRREALKRAAATLLAGSACRGLSAADAARAPRFRISCCTVNPEGAAKAGLDGVELRVREVGDRLDVADPEFRRRTRETLRETGLAASSLMMGLLNQYPLASDPRGPAWLEQAVEAAADLGAPVVLLAFFGKGDLLDDGKLKTNDVAVVVERLRAAAPKAKAAGVVLGVESYLSARQHADLLRRVDHPSVRIYYDVRNATDQGYDPPAEIRFLRDRIAMFHFKDGPNYLGEGRVRWKPVAEAIAEIGYRGWIVLETSSPSGDRAADARRNARFVRGLFGGK